jgi:hypothetical protein
LIRVSAYIAFLLVISIQLAEAKTAAETAAGIAKKRGYTEAQTKCYMEVFPQHASQNSAGAWVGPQKNTQAYKSILFSKCNIQR